MRGWTIEGTPSEEAKRCVILAAPHTSNWDYLYAIATGFVKGIKFKVAIKHFWTVFPFGIIIRPLGGIGIKRGKHRNESVSQIDMMIDLFSKYQTLSLIIAPEGTRKLKTKWKTGFYHVAHKAQVPLIPVFMDYTNRRIIFGPSISSDGTLEEVMKNVGGYYQSVDGGPKNPKLFSLDESYITQ